MKNPLYILPFLLLPVFCLAQEKVNDINNNKNYKNNINLGAEILATSFSYTRKITNNISIGAGFGFGFGLGFASSITTSMNQSSFNFQDGIIEVAHIGPVIEFKLSQYLYYELKPQLTVLTEGDLGQTFNAVGLKNGLFVRLKKIKLGLNVTVGKLEGNWLFYIQPIQLKIPLQW